MHELRIDWSTAEVSEGELHVELSGEVSKSWRRHFRRTVRLLASSEFSEVTVKKATIRVGGLEPGTEARLRRHLEAVVDQASSACEAEQQQEGAAPAEAEGPDGEMTATFRAFAGQEEHRGEGA